MAIDGTYDIVLQSPQGPQALTLTLVTSGDTVTGFAKEPDGPEQIDIQDAKLNGDNVTFKVSMTKPMKLTLAFDASVEGDIISGTAKVMTFKLKFEGKRL